MSRLRWPLLLLLLLLLSLPVAMSTGRTPVVLIPGDGGCQIEARLDGKTSVPHRWCSTKTADYFPIWLNLELLTYFTVDCFADNFRLVFDPATNLSSNSPNVSIRVPNFGDTEGIEYFDKSRISPSAYFNTLVSGLLADGYERNVSVRGAPFDFRRGLNDNPDLFDRLKLLIEGTVVANGNKPALLLAHSYGNPLALTFLQRQSPQWKAKYVRAFLLLAPPLAGAVKTLRLLASGDTLNIPFENPLTIRPLQRSFTSSAFLAPMAPLWSDKEVIASREGRNYTVADYESFFADAGFPQGHRMREANLVGYDFHKPPGVEVHCVHGYGLKTPGSFVWPSGAWPDTQPDVVYDDGDGTVNIRSLRACMSWRGKQGPGVYNLSIAGAEHLKIMHHEVFVNYTRNLLKGFDSEDDEIVRYAEEERLSDSVGVNIL